MTRYEERWREDDRSNGVDHALEFLKRETDRYVLSDSPTAVDDPNGDVGQSRRNGPVNDAPGSEMAY